MRTLLLACALIAALFGSSASKPDPAPVPYHAFCRTFWLFATTCAKVKTTLIKQIQAYNPKFGCEECQYTLVSAAALYINATHTSPDGLQAESLKFAFHPTEQAGGCRVFAQSISVGSTSVLDDSLNYCNLYNLLSASGLTSAPGFKEMTNEWACLGYGLASCKA